MIGLLIYKYEPFWQEVSVKSRILRWPFRPVGLLFLLQIVVVTIHCKCLYGIYKIFFTSYYTIINNYFRLLTKYSNQWNVLTEGISFETATLHLKMISNMLIRNVQGQHHIENLKCTWNWHDFEFQTQISSNCGKRRDAYLIAHFDIAWYIVEDEFEVGYCIGEVV